MDNSGTYVLRLVETAADWRHLHDIRCAVLFTAGRHAVAYDENHPDDRAEGHLPYLLFFEGRPVGVARLDLRGDVGVVRLVAIVTSQQGRGHGRALGALIEAEARRRDVTKLRLNAAANAVGFYEKTGWRRSAWDPAERAGIAADTVQMAKPL